MRSFTTDAMVEIRVGEHREKHYLHKQILVSESPYFSASLKNEWNGKTNAIELLDVDSPTIEAFADWVYTGKLPRLDTKGTKWQTEFYHFAKLYKFAVKIMSDTLCNALVDDLIATLKETCSAVGFNEVGKLVALGLLDTPLGELIMQDAAGFFIRNPTTNVNAHMNIEKLGTDVSTYQKLLRYIREYAAGNWKALWLEDKCKFHKHVDGKTCGYRFKSCSEPNKKA